jgi:hypothetical protein
MAALDVASSRPPPERRCKWNEESLATHAEERGVKYGTMKIDHPDTPFLYYDEDRDPVVAVRTNMLPEAREKQDGAVQGDVKQEFQVEELQSKLGLVAQAATSHESDQRFDRPKWGAAEAHAEFLAKRQALYAGEAELAGITASLPDGWTAYRARSEPHDVYFVNDATGEAVWERPTKPAPVSV